MNKNLKKLILAAIFAAIAVVGSMFSFPIFGSKCAPIQHIVNVMCAIFLGPWYGLGCAFVSSVIRNLLGLGTLLAFPGSMCGVLLAGLLYMWLKKRWGAYIGEVFGTAVIGGLLAYPFASLLMGNAEATLFTYVIPFLISTGVGTVIAVIIVEVMAGTGLLKRLQDMLK